MEFKTNSTTFQKNGRFADDMKRFAVDEAARFTTDRNEAASASMDEMAEHAVLLSGEKNKQKAEEKKQVLKEIREKKKSWKQNHPSIHRRKEFQFLLIPIQT